MSKVVSSLCVFLSLTVGGCRQQPSHPLPVNSEEAEVSVREPADVAELLQRIGNDPAYLTHTYVMGPERVQMLANRLIQENDPDKRISVRWQYALALLNAGQSGESVQELVALGREMEAHSPPRFRQNDLLLRLYTATAYLRIAEQENCLAHRSSDSCLFPFRPEGVHRHRGGSEQAKEQLESILTVNPSHLGARWLYTIANGTLSGPLRNDSDPWLIPEEWFSSEVDIGRFSNVAQEWGVDALGLAGGCVVEDFDGDGDLDILVSSWGLNDSLRLFWNRGEGRFEDGTSTSGLQEVKGGLNLIQADYDSDGHVDVLVLRGAWLGKVGRHPNSLLKNQGDGTFRDVTREAGLLSLYPTQTAVWLDYNLDGHLDLFVGNEDRGGEGHPCELFHNNGNGTFSSQASEQGLDVRRYVKGVCSADYDNNGWPDLYLSCLGSPNLLFRNDGSRFTEAAQAAGVTEPFDSFPTWFFDFDNDGDEDLFVSGYRLDGIGDLARDYLGLPHDAEKPRLYRNLGGGHFEDVTTSFGLDRLLLGMGGNVGDLNQDGFLDFYLGTGDPELMTLAPNRMFLNQAGKGFADVTTSGGFGHLQKGHGVAFADVDDDGAQDVYAVLGGAVSGDTYYNALFRNPGTNGRWLKLKLVGTEANRSAIGARIKVVINEKGGEWEVHRTVGSGGSFGANPLRVYLGLGSAESIQRVEILWPGNRLPEVFLGLELNRAYWLEEGAGVTSKLTLPSPGTTNQID